MENFHASISRSPDDFAHDRYGIDSSHDAATTRNRGDAIRQIRQNRFPDSTLCLAIFLSYLCSCLSTPNLQHTAILSFRSNRLDRCLLLPRRISAFTMESGFVWAE